MKQIHYIVSMKFHPLPECRTILRNYSEMLHISEEELLNRMILSYRKADCSLLTCLLMKSSDEF